MSPRPGPTPFFAHIGLMAAALRENADPAAATQAMSAMLLGVQKYQQYAPGPVRPSLHRLWESGSVSLQSIHEEFPQDGQPVVMLVPSMVNKAYIMDLLPERSLLRWLEGQGMTALLLDWGDPLTDSGMHSVDAAITERLLPAVRHAAQSCKAPVHVLGYCMGGTLLAGAARDLGDAAASFIFLAAPWDFHAGSQALLNRVKFWLPAARPLMEGRSILPLDWIQTIFASMDPAAMAQKFASFAAMDPASPEARLFVAVEDWLNDGVDLPAPLARTPIEEWFLANAPARGAWIVHGEAVDVASIVQPCLVITSRRDRLVEYDSAQALAEAIPGASLIDTDCGHIGMMAGRQAVTKTWEPVAQWVKARHRP